MASIGACRCALSCKVCEDNGDTMEQGPGAEAGRGRTPPGGEQAGDF